jgi:hypothetical protein
MSAVSTGGQGQTGLGESSSKQYAALAASPKVTITLDAAVFADGELVGPDKWRKPADAVARITASRFVAAQVRSGATLDAIIAEAQMTGQTLSPTAPEYRVARWAVSLATRLKQNHHPDAELEFMETRPVPPVLYRNPVP